MNISPVPFHQYLYGRFLNDHSRKIKHSTTTPADTTSLLVISMVDFGHGWNSTCPRKRLEVFRAGFYIVRLGPISEFGT